MDADEAARILDQVLNRFDTGAGSDSPPALAMDDQVTWAEFGAALAAEGVDAATADLLRDMVFADWDADRDRALSLPELRALAAAWAAPPGDQS